MENRENRDNYVNWRYVRAIVILFFIAAFALAIAAVLAFVDHRWYAGAIYLWFSFITILLNAFYCSVVVK